MNENEATAIARRVNRRYAKMRAVTDGPLPSGFYNNLIDTEITMAGYTSPSVFSSIKIDVEKALKKIRREREEQDGNKETQQKRTVR